MNARSRGGEECQGIETIKGVERLKGIKRAQDVKTIKGVKRAKTVLWFILRIFISSSHDDLHNHPHDIHCNNNGLDRRKDKNIQTTRERMTPWSVLT